VSGSSIDRRPSSAGGLADSWRAAWSEGTPQAFGACCAVAVHYEDPLLSEPVDGLDGLAQHAARLRTALPDMRVEPVGEPVADRGYGCLPWRILGTHKGSAGTLPPTGRFVVLHGVHYAELSDGLIHRARGFFDLYDAAVQLGLLPTRGSIGESAIMLVRGFGLRPRA